MRKLIFIAVVSLSSLGLADDFNALALEHRPVPSGHVVGKDNGAGSGLHNAGEDCGICHTPNGKAGNVLFTMAGTLYADRMGRVPLEGGEVILQDIAGNVISMTSNKIGNFWTTAPIAPNPLAVGSHGGTTEGLFTLDAGVLVPADPADSRTWQYKAWIRNGDQVRHMVTIAPVGGATGTTPRMSCNMHHSPLGGSGALWVGKPAVPPMPETLSFKKHVQPIFVGRCAPCHIPGKRFTRLVTASDLPDAGSPTSFDYSSGHDFTSYGGSSVVVTEGGVMTTYAKQGVRGAVDPTSPAQSKALQKTLVQAPGTVVHAGGAFWTKDDADYKLILKWIEGGALDN